MTPIGTQPKDGGDPRWREEAACFGEDPDMWFPVRLLRGARTDARDTYNTKVARAKTICARCPVREECLDFALRTNQRDGIWGGATETERDRIRRRNQVAS